MLGTKASSPDPDITIAERIAESVRERGGRRGGWYEVRALMSEFGIERFSADAQQRMTSALTAAGLSVEPPLGDVARRDTVVLTSGSQNGQPPGRTEPSAVEECVTVRVADPGGRLSQVPPGQRADGPRQGGVHWIDVRDSARISPAELLEVAGPYCGGQLDLGMVEDLLSPDPRPRIKRHAGGAVRCVSAFQVLACESDEGASDTSSSKAGVLLFEPVEFLVGTGWLITSWHDVEVYRGAERIREARPSPPAALFDEVERCWPGPGLTSAGDLAVLVLKELALTYAAAYRQFYIWEEEWELDFYRRPDRVDSETLLEVRALAAILRDWLSPLNPPGMRQDADKAWFPGITGTPERGGHELALRTDDRIDQALRALQEFTDTLRSAYDLLQLRQRERERERDDRFQRNIAVWGAAILVPTLVAGIMGANTWVPGQWSESHKPPHWAFLVLFALVVLSGLAAWLVIKRAQARDERDS